MFFLSKTLKIFLLKLIYYFNKYFLINFKYKIIPYNNIKENKFAKKIFLKSKIVKFKTGIYQLDPMPSSDLLDDYYKNYYWKSRGNKIYGTTVRDFIHFEILKKYIPNVFTKGKTFLNYGAGHAGISNILLLNNFNIINVEKSSLPDFYNRNWITYQDINDVPDKSVDIFYASHSLEHVQNIEIFIKEVIRTIKSDAILFFEVPNGAHKKNGLQTGKVDIPHTYYFLNIFFENFFDITILNKCYDQNLNFSIDNWESLENPEGEVIRALGKII